MDEQPELQQHRPPDVATACQHPVAGELPSRSTLRQGCHRQFRHHHRLRAQGAAGTGQEAQKAQTHHQRHQNTVEQSPAVAEKQRPWRHRAGNEHETRSLHRQCVRPQECSLSAAARHGHGMEPQECFRLHPHQASSVMALISTGQQPGPSSPAHRHCPWRGSWR